eukprot:6491680-Amphidinium_carterae.1
MPSSTVQPRTKCTKARHSLNRAGAVKAELRDRNPSKELGEIQGADPQSPGGLRSKSISHDLYLFIAIGSLKDLTTNCRLTAFLQEYLPPSFYDSSSGIIMSFPPWLRRRSATLGHYDRNVQGWYLLRDRNGLWDY